MRGGDTAPKTTFRTFALGPVPAPCPGIPVDLGVGLSATLKPLQQHRIGPVLVGLANFAPYGKFNSS